MNLNFKNSLLYNRIILYNRFFFGSHLMELLTFYIIIIIVYLLISWIKFYLCIYYKKINLSNKNKAEVCFYD